MCNLFCNKQTAVVKKKLNIPVTDIAQDKKYDDDNVMSPFVLPTSYVRHIKIMSDEPDLTVDYCIEDEDMVRKNTRLTSFFLLALLSFNFTPYTQYINASSFVLDEYFISSYSLLLHQLSSELAAE